MINKICTSIEQSNKLLSLGLDPSTADMYWWYSGKRYYVESMDDDDFNKESDIPAWSLAALLGVIPEPDLIQNSEGTWTVHSWINAYPWSVGGYSNPVDACVAIIEKLHKLKKL